jgi:hypothetical protein
MSRRGADAFRRTQVRRVLPLEWIPAGLRVFRTDRHAPWGSVYLAVLIISGFVAVPILNLLTPLFAAAFETRVVKRLA